LTAKPLAVTLSGVRPEMTAGTMSPSQSAANPHPTSIRNTAAPRVWPARAKTAGSIGASRLAALPTSAYDDRPRIAT
jgi:hypothetical protein